MRSGDQTPVVSCVDWTVRIKWQMTVVSRGGTVPVLFRWNGQIVLIASTIHNGQNIQTGHRGQIDRRDMTDPDTISSCRKTMSIEEGG